MALSISWKKNDTPEELHPLLTTLAQEYPVGEDSGGEIAVCFDRSESPDTLKVTRNGDDALICYGRANQALRGLGALMAGLPEDGAETVERCPFISFGIMLDCSRNAVMKVEHLKKWLRRLALFGYDMVMLYTEDTYELPGEEYFGYLRGRYTADELKEIDRYAASLGIEMRGCIQTLGHLNQILKWPAYGKIKDTGSVLMAGEEASYDLITKMIERFAKCFTSRRLHLGMDETHDLGRGRYMDKNGHERGFDIFNKHLSRVVKICKDRGIEPMIWSDMYFRMGSKTGDYYDRDSKIPADVATKIPAEAQLVYWDYYHEEADFYREWIRRHRALGFEPAVASGVWTWRKLWYQHEQTRRCAPPCLDACMQEGVAEVFFTMWGDDGAFCEFDSALAGLCYTAEYGFGGGEPDDETLEKRFNAICGAGYRETLLPDRALNVDTPGAPLLWDDPLLGIFFNEIMAKEETGKLEKAMESLSDLAQCTARDAAEYGTADMGHARQLALTLKLKIALRLKLVEAYDAGDKKRLAEVRDEADEVVAEIENLGKTFRRQWLRRNKPHGLEVIQIRLAGQAERHRELQRRIDEYIEGGAACISELEERSKQPKGAGGGYRALATASSIL